MILLDLCSSSLGHEKFLHGYMSWFICDVGILCCGAGIEVRPRKVNSVFELLALCALLVYKASK